MTLKKTANICKYLYIVTILYQIRSISIYYSLSDFLLIKEITIHIECNMQSSNKNKKDIFYV